VGNRKQRGKGLENDIELALKMKEGTMSWGIQATSSSWKR
jgi:hypothetical protein